MLQARLGAAALLLAAAWSSPLHAQQMTFEPRLWGLCPPDELAHLLTEFTGAEADDSPVEFSSDQATSGPLEALLQGDVQVYRGDQQLKAPAMMLDRESNIVTATDEIVYGDPNIAVRAEGGVFDLDEDVGQFNSADYYFAPRNARGSAGAITVRQREESAELAVVTYSTCERDSPFWQLRSDRMVLDQRAGRGEAWDISVALLDTPVLYLPYLSFPINDERQSGFLVPSAGYDSEGGFDFRLPYYWNIAPNMDATLAPRVITNRGLLLGGEFRYLTHKDRGSLHLEYLPSDQEYGDDRYSVKALHQSNPMGTLYTDLLFQEVSDDDYIEDLDNFLGLTSPDYLEQRFDVRYFGRGWQALARLQDFDTIDQDLFENNEPYSRQPQLLFDSGWRLGGFDYGLRGEWVDFDHPSKVTGQRLDVWPRIGYPLEWSWGFFKPEASYRYTTYDLEGTDPGQETTPDRGAPILSVDTGLIFERPVDWGWLGQDMVQTLEPRLYYLRVPYRDQTDLPLFDTDDIDRSYAWLFLDNRFVGADRLGDANQLTTAVTTRLLGAEDGRERLRLSLGQVQYFDPPRVGLEQELDERSESELIAEAMVRVSPSIELGGALQWDSSLDVTRRGAFDMRYRSDNDHIVNVAYRFSRDDLEQTDVAMLWRLNPQWRVAGRWNYSLIDDQTIDLAAGLEYGDCCWAVRFLARHHRLEPEDEDAKNSFYVELELKGFTSVGRNIENYFEDAVIGYERTRY